MEERGWGWLHDDPLCSVHSGEESESVVDVEPLQEWLRRRASFDASAGLELWNFAVDALRVPGVAQGDG